MVKTTSVLSLLLVAYALIAQSTTNNQKAQDSDGLLSQYIQTKGAGIITFDASNIKQFWIDSSVVSKKDHFKIVLKEGNKRFESIPLKLQLVNVSESQDCKIEVIANTEDFGFSVLDNKNKLLSTSSSEDNFIHYTVVSSVFHWENTSQNVFNIVFNSKNQATLSIKKIVLSFSNNPNSSFLVSPGKITLSLNDVTASSKKADTNDYSFFVTGKRFSVFSYKKFYALDNTFSSSVKIKNTGDIATTVYIGYRAFTREHIQLDGKNYPYNKTNKVLKVVFLAKEGTNKIIVDSYSEWAKNCYLALDAKEDMSDIPNTIFAGSIAGINKLENGQAEITLNSPLKSEIKEGTTVRIHGRGGAYLYTNNQILQPGEEQVFTATIKKDDSSLEYSSKAFSRGVYFVSPLILSYSTDSSKENTILISDYTISY